jgi:hypothetical protein
LPGKHYEQHRNKSIIMKNRGIHLPAATYSSFADFLTAGPVFLLAVGFLRNHTRASLSLSNTPTGAPYAAYRLKIILARKSSHGVLVNMAKDLQVFGSFLEITP